MFRIFDGCWGVLLLRIDTTHTHLYCCVLACFMIATSHAKLYGNSVKYQLSVFASCPSHLPTETSALGTKKNPILVSLRDEILKKKWIPLSKMLVQCMYTYGKTELRRFLRNFSLSFLFGLEQEEGDSCDR